MSYQWMSNGTALVDGGNISGTSAASLTFAGAIDANQGSYYVLVSNSAGTTTSSTMTLTVLDPPAIFSQPASATRGTGLSVVFTVGANGAPTLNYQWLKNGGALVDGGNISGSTTVALTVSGITVDDSASYQCVVTNNSGNATSANALLTVVIPAGISSQPSSQTIDAGSSAVFSVGASGSAPFVYSWTKDGSPLANGGHVSGVNTANLTISSASAADMGSYAAVVSNGGGTATSSAAVLSVVGPPAITGQPTSATVDTGSNAVFNVSAQSSIAMSYQWLKNGTPMVDSSNIVGSITASLTISNAATTDAASYQCVVTNDAGSVTSTVATLTIVVSPTLDNPPLDRTVNLGSVAVFSASASGTAPLIYSWNKNGSALTNGGRIFGANSATLTITNVAAADAGSYTIAVTNLGGSVTSAAAMLTVITPPSFLAQPTNVTVNAGSMASLSVTAQGSQPLVYQWMHSGVLVTNSATISGATSQSLTLLSASALDAGSYKCIVTNSAGSATSSLATVTVILPPTISTEPANQTMSTGSTVTFSVGVSGTAPFTYAWSKNGSPLANGGKISGATSAVLTVASIADTDAGSYSCTVSNNAGIASSDPGLLTVSHATAIISQPASQTLNACDSLVLSVAVGGVTIPTYQWMHNGSVIADGTNATYFLNTVSGPDAGTYYVQVTGDTVVNSSNAVVVVHDPSIFGQPADNCVLANATNVFVVQACGVSLSYQWYFIPSGSATATLLTGQTSSTLSVGPVKTQNAGQYYCVVSNSFNSVTSRVASLGVEASPTITSQPANQVVAVGGTATFKVAAKANAPLTFQWVKNHQNIIGATNSSYIIDSVQTNDAGTYQCHVGTTLCQSTVLTSVAAGRLAVAKAKPTSKFTAPLSNTQYPTGSAELVGQPNPPQQILVSGIASDTGRVTDVTLTRTFPPSAPWTVHPELVGVPTMYHWTNTVMLVPGTNVFAAVVTDAAGLTATNAVTVFLRVRSALHIANVGAGTNLALPPTTFGKPTNNALLDIGRNYRVQAKPAAGNMFSNWVDGNGVVLSRLALLEFRMQTNLQLVANFATNPVLANAANGSYNGLFYETNEVQIKSAGALFNFTVRTDATFSGTMKLDGRTYLLTGSFDINGDATKYVTRLGKTTLTVQLHLDFITKQITGTVSSPDPDAWTADVLADIAPYSAANKFQNTKRYTLAVPPDSGAPIFSPGGFGYGFVTNNSLGVISFIGTLADGTAVSQTVPISQQQYWPFYIPLYANRGLIEGWINFSSGSPRGNISWIRPAGKLTTTYTNGFTNEVAIFGAPYTPRTPSLTPADGALNIGYPAMTYQYAVSNNNAIVVLPGSPNNNLSGSITAGTGAVTVSYRPTGSAVNQIGRGAVLQWNSGAYGFTISGGISAPLHLH